MFNFLIALVHLNWTISTWFSSVWSKTKTYLSGVCWLHFVSRLWIPLSFQDYEFPFMTLFQLSKTTLQILVSNQHDEQFFFLICLFQFPTSFEQPRAHHQENHLYQYNIWYMSLCVGDPLVCRSGINSFLTCILEGHLHRVTYTRCCIDTIDSTDDEHGVAGNM